MPDFFDKRIVFGLRAFSYIVSLLAIALGCAVLLGWLLRSPTLVTVRPGLAAMAPLTACGFVLAGLSIASRRSEKPTIAAVSAGLIICLNVVILGSYASTGHDTLNPIIGNRLHVASGRIEGHTSPAAAFGFLLLAACLMFLGGQRPRIKQAIAALASAGTLVSGLALLGYAYGVEGIYATTFYHSTALHTASGLFLLFLACFMFDPESGWPSILASARPSGAAARVQLVLAILVPSCMGLILVRETRAGSLAPSLAIALIVISATIPIVVRIFVDGHNLDSLDMQLHEAIDAKQDLNNELEARVQARTAQLQIAETALRQSQKMEAVGQLTSGIAHDFNNLLTGIIGSVQLMQIRLAQGRTDDIAKYAMTAESAATRAASLTHRLLAFSRKQMLDPKAIDINQLVSGLEELIRRTVGPTVTIEIVEAANLWTTLADPSQVESALLNLVINARDAMPNGGKLVIETDNTFFDKRGDKNLDIPSGQYVSLAVSDNGTGMASEVVARAFDPFFTTKPIGMGSGLGLSMVYGFAQQSGGQARIYSEVGNGTTVALYLPRVVEDALTEHATAEVAVVQLAKPGETVLVVDDESSVRVLVVDVLEDLGYLVFQAEDGPAALEMLSSTERIDLLISDIGLPGGMNGRQLADASNALRPNLKVLFITGFAQNAILRLGHLEPGNPVLTKPFSIEELTKRVNDTLNGGM